MNYNELQAIRLILMSAGIICTAVGILMIVTTGGDVNERLVNASASAVWLALAAVAYTGANIVAGAMLKWLWAKLQEKEEEVDD